MKRSPSGIAVVLGLVVAGLGLSLFLVSRVQRGAGSIVLVTIDTLRWDRPGFDGGKGGLTPNLDRLAAEGAVFEDASAAAPLTLPSHATILTGLLPPRHGLRDNDSPRPLPAADLRDFLTGAEILRGSGYATAAFVSGAPLAPRWGLDAGFETYDAPDEEEPGSLTFGERVGAETVDRAIAWLRGRNPRRPFFLWVHLFDPHHPYRAPGGAGFPPDSAAAYDEEVKYADAQAGRLLDELRSTGLLASATVAVCSDHGEGLGEHDEATHGYFLHRSTLRVPFVLRAPSVPAGTRVKEAVSLADLLPTVLDAAGRPVPEKLLDGRSLMPHFRGGAPLPAPSPQYAETVYGWRAFRWAEGITWRRGNLRAEDFGGERREVHDLAADPGEETSLGAAAEGAAETWALFGSPPRTRAAATGRPVDPSLMTIPYVSAYSPVAIADAAGNGKLPLPSTSFLRDFESALRLLDRARAQPSALEAAEEMETAVKILTGLALKDPANPAPPFWLGRALRQRARHTGSEATGPWVDAFFHFLEAFRLGYREPRTVSLMMEAAFQAKRYPEMLKVARDASEGDRMDGDASYWCWVSLSWWMANRDAAGNPTTEGRTRAQEALAKARGRARGAEESRRIAEIEAIYR